MAPKQRILALARPRTRALGTSFARARIRALRRLSSRIAAALLAVSCVLAPPLAGCGGAAKKVPITPTTPEQLRVFEHGVDFVAALEGIEGRWRDDWDRELQERVGAADFIGTVHVETLLTETDPEQIVTHRLVARVTRNILGDAGKTVELRVHEGELGFPTIHDNVSRIQARDFLAYVKWFQDDAGERAAHFHLSPASEPVIAETERVIGLRKGGVSEEADGGRTIVYTH